jgi:hypothetical protein
MTRGNNPAWGSSNIDISQWNDETRDALTRDADRLAAEKNIPWEIAASVILTASIKLYLTEIP